MLALELQNPESRLHARADGNDLKSLLFLQNRNGGANAGVQISLSNAINDQSENRLAYIRAFNTGASQNGNHLTFGTNPNGGPPVERIRITDIGNCGIGTSSPDQLLHLKSSSSFLAISNSADTGDSGLLFRRTDNNQNRGYVIYDFTNDALKFRASTNGAGEAMRITSAGLVGINEPVRQVPCMLMQILALMAPCLTVAAQETQITHCWCEIAQIVNFFE